MEGIAFRPDKPYETVVLGIPRAGKTVFLSSLYKRLSVAQPDQGTRFYLNTNDGTRLLAIYHKLSAEKQWPTGTRNFISYDFQLRTNIEFADSNGNPVIEACDHLAYRFYDIPGNSITGLEAKPGWAERMKNLIDKSDNLVVLIDGEVVLRALNGQSDADLFTQLDYILPTVQNAPGKPLHFVVTKWDLMDNALTPSIPPSDQLRQVREKLCQHTGFVSILRQQSDLGIPTRLIPVSSVGTRFAELRNGSMSIISSAVIDPIRVELPIALVLWDGLSLVRQQVDKKQKSEQSALGNLESFKSLFESFPRIFDAIPSPTQLSIGRIVIVGAASLAQLGLGSLIKNRNRELVSLKLQEEGLRRVLEEFGAIVRNLEIEFPDSRLVEIGAKNE